jgi:TRAP transporter TAXI family solute receptor
MLKAIRCACLITPALALLATGSVAVAEKGEVDPGKVSEGLKAIFSYGQGRTTRDRLNANTITIITGTIGGTYVQIGADLASALDAGDDLRILPIVGRGSVQSIADILYLKGVDVGVIRSDTLDYLERKGYAANLKKQLSYITKLYNEEMHVVALKSVQKLSDLAGKNVAVDLPNGGTFITAITVFERLGIKANFVYVEQRLAYEKLRKGEIDAMIAVQGVPSKFTTTIKDERFHLVPVDYTAALQSDYLPSQLKAEDYPALIPAGQRVDTIAVPAILASYDWPVGSERYRKVERFVDAFFGKFETLQKPPFHPKWKEVSLMAPLPGWKRFAAAQSWLDRHTDPSSEMRHKFDQFMANREGGKTVGASPEQNSALFEQFLEWQKTSAAKQARPTPANGRKRTSRAATADGH